MAIVHTRHRYQNGPIPCFVLILLAGILIYFESPLVAQRPDVQRASTDRATRDNVSRQIPFKQFRPIDRAKAENVVRNVSIFRRLPIRVVQCNPEMFAFLIKHPDVVVNIWQVLGLSKLEMEQTGPDTFVLTDNTQTRLTLRYIYRSEGTCIVYSEGACDGPLFKKPAEGQCLMILRSGFVHETDGRDYLTCRLDSFLHVEKSGLELLTKTFQPILGKVADFNFMQTIGFIGSLSRTAEVNPTGMQHLASKLTTIKPEVRREFVQLLDRISERSPSQPVPIPIPVSPPQVAKGASTSH